MARPEGFGHLNTSEWERLLDYVDRFEKAWQQNADSEEGLDLRDFLPPAEDVLRSAVLHELIKTDLEIRWRGGQGVPIEDYLTRCPELGDAAALSPELLYEEYRVRELFGDRPGLASYEARFPAQFASLRQLVHDLPIPTRSGLGAGTSPAPPSASPLPPEGTGQILSVGGGYELLEFLGGGGFGNVWRAKAPGGVDVAIKRISRPLDHNERQRESQALELIKQLRHPYLLQTHAFYPLPGELIIAMELADGSLRDRLKQCRKEGKKGIPTRELLGYFREAADALDFLHSRNVQHRDIKPDNILVQQDHAKVADFGLARPQDLEKSMIDSGSGTPPYTAPEVWLGKIKPGSDSDQYSLAVTYVELRLDRRLYPGSAMMELMLAHVEGTPDLSPLSDPEQQALLRALAKDPSKRYPSCRDFVNALEASLAKELKLSQMDRTFTEGNAAVRGPSRSGGKTDVDTIVPSMGAARSLLLPSESSTHEEGERTSPTPLVDRTRPGWKPVESKKKLTGKPRLFKAIAMFLVLVCAAIAAYAFMQPPPPPTETKKEDDPGTVVGPRELDTLPKYCKKVDDAKIVLENGKNYYDRIEHEIPKNHKVEFVLVPAVSNTSKPYYIMADKVWVGLFKEYVEYVDANPPKDFSNRAWEKYTNDSTWKDKPIMEVTALDAHYFAKWLWGTLPTHEEWDNASGLDIPNVAGPDAFTGIGPYQPCEEPWEGKIGVGIEGPTACPLDKRQGSHDYYISKRFGTRIYDLAGNGLEWTSVMESGELIAKAIERLNQLDDDDAVKLRGRRYKDTKPLEYTYYQLEYLKRMTQQSRPLKMHRDDISFRVVLHPPKGAP